MQLGGLNPIPKQQIGQVSERDFDFSALERKVDSIGKMQTYILIALVALIFLNFYNGKN